MTDEKKSGDTQSAEQEEEALTVSEELPEAEAWQDELPPEDDFHDPGEFSEELQEEIVEEALSAEAYEDQEDSAQPKANRSKGILWAAIGVGVIFIGGLAYLQFGVNSDAPTSSPLLPVSAVLDVHEIKNPQQPVKPMSDVEGLISQTTGKTDLSKIYSDVRSSENGEKRALPDIGGQPLVSDKPTADIRSDVLTTTAQTDSAPPVGAPAQAPAADSPQEAPPATDLLAPPPLEEMPQIAKVEDIPLPKASKGAEKPAAAVDAVKMTEADEKIKQLTAKIDSLQKSLDEAERKNENLTVEVDSLHDQLKQLSDKPTAVAAKPAKKTRVSEATTSKKTSAVKKKSKKKSAKKIEWVLRAATPRDAWVAPSPDSSELRRIRIGETLPGLGKIKEIRPNGSVWEVVGSQGTLR
ncbi:MAG: hypothetical protein AB7E52_01965 [Bdellovibrionales bacterium]